MAKNLMAERLAEFLKELPQFDPAWKDREPDLSHQAVRAAFRKFKLDPRKPHHQRRLLLLLALVVFGRRKAGRPKGKRAQLFKLVPPITLQKV
jgi:hypothetical protein